MKELFSITPFLHSLQQWKHTPMLMTWTQQPSPLKQQVHICNAEANGRYWHFSQVSKALRKPVEISSQHSPITSPLDVKMSSLLQSKGSKWIRVSPEDIAHLLMPPTAKASFPTERAESDDTALRELVYSWFDGIIMIIIGACMWSFAEMERMSDKAIT